MGASPGDQMRKLTVTEPFMTGDDVKAAQRVLHDNRFKINFHPGKVDSQFGPKAADATRLAKFLLGYPEAEVNGEFGPNLYGYLVAKGAPGYKQRPSTFVAPSAARRRLFKPNHSVRERMVSWCLWAVANTDQIHYEKKRPIPVHDLPGTLPLTTDCSGSTTLFARWAVGAGSQRPRVRRQREHDDDARAPAADHRGQGPARRPGRLRRRPHRSSTSWSSSSPARIRP